LLNLFCAVTLFGDASSAQPEQPVGSVESFQTVGEIAVNPLHVPVARVAGLFVPRAPIAAPDAG
jgi:hypothetical protein